MNYDKVIAYTNIQDLIATKMHELNEAESKKEITFKQWDMMFALLCELDISISHLKEECIRDKSIQD